MHIYILGRALVTTLGWSLLPYMFNQPKIVTKALPRPVTLVDLKGEPAQELADRRVLNKQIQF